MSDQPSTWPALNPHERRVLGVLVEKQKTTPDAYPMSLNGLTTGCNQKSNRDPVMNLDDFEVEEALASVQKRGLVFRIEGSGRVEKWRHNLYPAWSVSEVEIAILAELLLRGPQTEGELRGRASRMNAIDDLDELRALLSGLAARKLVAYLTPEGRRGTVVTHGFHEPVEFAQLRQRSLAGFADADAPPARPVPAPPVASDRMSTLERQVAEALAQIAALQTQVGDLKTRVQKLQSDLGETAVRFPFAQRKRQARYTAPIPRLTEPDRPTGIATPP